MVRKQALYFLLALFLTFAHSCKDSLRNHEFSSEPTVSIDLKEIQERGYLQAIVDNNSTSYFIYRGTSMGYEYELLKRLSSFLKVDLKVKVISGIEEAVEALNNGEGDVLAFPLTITSDRKDYLAFTEPHYSTHQVLVQKKPANWRLQPPAMVEKQLVRNPSDLIGKDVYVMKGSSFQTRLENLSEEIGGDINILEDSSTAETESLIRKVATGEIKYTVTDQTIAMVNSLYYPNLDINTMLSLAQQIAWGIRKNSPDLLKSVNTWLVEVQKDGTLPVIFGKYFNSPRFSLFNISSDYSSLAGDKLSPYDDALKEGAKLLGWDWRLVASIVYQESNFNPQVTSWAGAIGLMQIMPETGDYFGIHNIRDPDQNIKVGMKLLKFLDDYWAKSITDPEIRIKFVLASYNVGLSHVIDSRNLANKFGKSPVKWEDNVEFMMLQKSNPKYYQDPVAVAGYCRCDGPVLYVRQVLQRYEEYKIHFK